MHRVGQLNKTFTTLLRCSAVGIDRTIFDNHDRRGGLMKLATRTREQKQKDEEARRARIEEADAQARAEEAVRRRNEEEQMEA